MQVTKVEIDYQSNYNGCTVLLHVVLDDGCEDVLDSFDVKELCPQYLSAVETVQNAVIEEAYKDVIKSGRHEGEFNGSTNKLKTFALTVAATHFSDISNITFTVDDSST